MFLSNFISGTFSGSNSQGYTRGYSGRRDETGPLITGTTIASAPGFEPNDTSDEKSEQPKTLMRQFEDTKCYACLFWSWDFVRSNCLALCLKVPCGCACAISLLQPPPVRLASIKLTDTQKTRLQALRTKALAVYDPTVEEHQHLLYSFGVYVFGEAFQRSDLISPRWKTIGFQGNDPSTDFRGSGLLGLENLYYVVSLDQRLLKRMSRYEHVPREYYLPFAIAGINVTYTLIQMLFITANPERMITAAQAQVYRGFLTLLQEEQFAFEEVYKSALQLLEERWADTHAKYHQFPDVMRFVRDRISEVLARQPSSIMEFNQILAMLDGEI